MNWFIYKSPSHDDHPPLSFDFHYCNSKWVVAHLITLNKQLIWTLSEFVWIQLAKKKTYKIINANILKYFFHDWQLKQMYYEMVASFHSLSPPFPLIFYFYSSRIASLVETKSYFNLGYYLHSHCFNLTSPPLSPCQQCWRYAISPIDLLSAQLGLMHLQINVRVIGSVVRYLDCMAGTSWPSSVNSL